MGWQQPVLEGRAVSERAGLPGQYRHVMPGVVDRLAATKLTAMLADNRAVLADDDALGIGLDLDRPADGARTDRVLIVVEPHQAGLRHRCLGGVKAVERADDLYELRALRLKHLPDRAVGLFGMRVALGVGNALVEQPAVQLVVTRHSQARCEQPLANIADLVLDLPLLPPRRRRAGDGLDQIMPENLQKVPVKLAVLATEHGLDRRFHVVVDAACAAALENLESEEVGVKHHLLALE